MKKITAKCINYALTIEKKKEQQNLTKMYCDIISHLHSPKPIAKPTNQSTNYPCINKITRQGYRTNHC